MYCYVGQLSAFYQYMPNDIQVKGSQQTFSIYTENKLHQFITIIAKMPKCMLGERLYDFELRYNSDTLLHQKENSLFR